MKERIWEILLKKKWTARHIVSLFLLCNTMVWSFVGFVIWFIIHFFSLQSLDWAICFIGYAAYFMGMIGGFIFLCRKY